jgi:serine/threonine protein phosphatase PrpC
MNHTQQLRQFEFGNHTDTGLARQRNEDYHGYFNTPNGHVFVVADGMGGHNAGHIASRLAVDTIREVLNEHFFERVPDALEAAIQEANARIYLAAAHSPEQSGMGTTVVMVIIRDERLWYAHVGDSRLYLLKNSHLQQLTRDHSVVQGFVDQGLLAASEMEHHPRKHELTRALGVLPQTEVAVSPDPLRPDPEDLFLLCTDGLNGYATEPDIQTVLERRELDIVRRAILLTELANKGGGGDNITVQIIRFVDIAQLAVATPLVPELHSEAATRRQPILKRSLLLLAVLVVLTVIVYLVMEKPWQEPAVPTTPVADTTAQPTTPAPQPADSAVTDTHNAALTR